MKETKYYPNLFIQSGPMKIQQFHTEWYTGERVYGSRRCYEMKKEKIVLILLSFKLLQWSGAFTEEKKSNTFWTMSENEQERWYIILTCMLYFPEAAGVGESSFQQELKI